MQWTCQHIPSNLINLTSSKRSFHSTEMVSWKLSWLLFPCDCKSYLFVQNRLATLCWTHTAVTVALWCSFYMTTSRAKWDIWMKLLSHPLNVCGGGGNSVSDSTKFISLFCCLLHRNYEMSPYQSCHSDSLTFFWYYSTITLICAQYLYQWKISTNIKLLRRRLRVRVGE